MIIEKLQLTSI
jgi:hypothetical protein